jgi:hypothetical protein
MPRVFARIVDGKVAEIINEIGEDTIDNEWPASMVATFVDITEEDPLPAVGDNYDDPGFSSPSGPVLSPAEEMRAAFMAGLELESTGTPALDATYHGAGPRWQLMMHTLSYITAFSAFPSGLVTMEWVTKTGDVTFPSAAAFEAVAKAVFDWGTEWQRYVDEFEVAPPSNSVTIA